MSTKSCQRCKIEKDNGEFESKNGKQLKWCKACRIRKQEENKKYNADNENKVKIYQKNYKKENKQRLDIQLKQYYQDNKEDLKTKSKQYRENNLEKCLDRQKKYYYENKETFNAKKKEYYQNNKEHLKTKAKEYRARDPEADRARSKKYYHDNKDKRTEYARQYVNNKLKSDPIFKLKMYTSHRVREALKRTSKSQRTYEYLGCTIEELRDHIEKQFKDGMSWDNYGSEWHIDHKIPIMYKNPTSAEVSERLHYTNTQPLWKKENMTKGNRFISG